MDPELPPYSEPPAESPTEPDLAAKVPVMVVPDSSVPPGYRDRSTGLTLFGVLQIILGVLAALMVPLALLGAFLSRLAPGGAMHPRQYVSGIATYIFAAVALLTLGIGSVQAKRWAHALTLVTSWYWLMIGVLVTVLLTATLPVTMKTALAQAQQNASGQVSGLSTGIVAVVLTMIIVFAAIFLIVIPIAFVAFYGRKDVAETCRHRDPVERWTDRTPLPVLGASVVLFVGALYMLVIGITTPLFPFFGRYLTGVPGTACFACFAVLDAYLAVALYRLRSSGWWIAFVTLVARLISGAFTYARADIMQAYSKMGFSDAQLRILNSNPMFRSHVILWWSLFSMIALFAYLIWLKRYFKAPESPLPPDPLPAPIT